MAYDRSIAREDRRLAHDDAPNKSRSKRADRIRAGRAHPVNTVRFEHASPLGVGCDEALLPCRLAEHVAAPAPSAVCARSLSAREALCLVYRQRSRVQSCRSATALAKYRPRSGGYRSVAARYGFEGPALINTRSRSLVAGSSSRVRTQPR